MASLIELTQWEASIYQIETTDNVVGGNDGISNRQGKQLANRTAYLKQQVELKAPIASPTFTGVPAVPTATVDTNTTQVASTAFVLGQVATVAPVVNGVAAVGTSTKFARQDHVHPIDTTRAPVASPTFTGIPAAPTAGDGDNTSQVATTAFVQSAVGGYLSKAVTGGSVTLTDAEASNPVIALSGTLTANQILIVPTAVKRLWAIYNSTSGAFTLTVKTASGTGVTIAQGKRNLVYTDGTNVYDGFNDFESVDLTGIPTTTTAAADTSTTQVASTAFVIGQAATVAPVVNGVATVGTSTKFARQDHVHPVDTKAAPPGEVAYFAMSSAPTGWIKCNGAAISRTTYATLFTAIGTTFGPGDGSTTFNLPDLRGEFIRGFDDSRGVDSGHSLGGAQSAYAGSITLSIGTYTVNAGTTAVITDSVTMNGVTVGSDVTETKIIDVSSGDNRPRNIALLACIKY